MSDLTINRFRMARGHILSAQIRALAAHLQRDIRILDVGGRPDYWGNVRLEGVAGVEILSDAEDQLQRNPPAGVFFSTTLGDARNLAGYADKSFDLVHSNSVIEHVGGWDDMAAMAREVVRVGRAGWIQTPAWEFPIEPHFRAPFVHWFGPRLRRHIMWLAPDNRYWTPEDILYHCRRIRLLSRSEVRRLFPGCKITTERFYALPKSHVVRWTPEGLAA
jgi:hypothetical protein